MTFFPFDITAEAAIGVFGLFFQCLRIFKLPLFTIFGVPICGWNILCGIFAVNLSVWFIHRMFEKVS